jgi:hypothetical protein
MKMWFHLLLAFCLLTGTSHVSAQKTDYGSLRVDTTPTKDERELYDRSTLIVFGWTDSAHREYRTGERVPSGELYNFVQKIHVKRALKGTSSQFLNLLTTGIEPLPDANDPLNNRYPGPLAEGEYVCFLKPVSGTDLYTIIGVWQGVYPLIDGKTVAIKGAGYTAFDQLTIQQLATKLKAMLKPPR